MFGNVEVCEWEILNNTQQKAWDLLCKDVKGSLHQFDFWSYVPTSIQDLYLEKTKES